jgi:hypothetical protein
MSMTETAWSPTILNKNNNSGGMKKRKRYYLVVLSRVQQGKS